jgi:hypothetical protein
MAWSLFWGFFWTIAISFLILVGIIYFTDSPSSGMDGVGRAAQKVVYQVGNLFGDQGFASRFGMAPSSPTTQTDNHEHSGARWERKGFNSHWTELTDIRLNPNSIFFFGYRYTHLLHLR